MTTLNSLALILIAAALAVSLLDPATAERLGDGVGGFVVGVERGMGR